MVSGDLVVRKALNVGVAREHAWIRKSSTICEWSVNFLNIMVSGNPVVKEALTVAVARKQAQTWKSSTVCECSGNF